MNLGAHISIAGGYEKSFDRAEQIGCSVMQIFTKSPNIWEGQTITDAEARAFKDRWSLSGIKTVIVHNSYLVNIAHPHTELWTKSIDAFTDEIDRVETLGIASLVTHPGSHRGSGLSEGINRIVSAIDIIHKRTKGSNVEILLETTAGQGNVIGSKFEHLSEIIERVNSPELIGVCLDTAHIFSAGYDITTGKSFENVLRRFSRTTGLRKLKAIHLNDSLTPFNSNVDRHANIGDGEIGIEAFRFLVNRKSLRHIPMILETPGGEKMFERNLGLLRNLRS